MLTAVTVDQIIGKDRVMQWVGTEERAELNERIISIVLAPPSSKVWDWVRDAQVRAHWDKQTDRAWHLYFAGVSAWEPDTEPLRSDGDGTPWALNVEMVHSIARELSARHGEALVHTMSSAHPWRYAGDTELVSFLTRNGEPDWMTLRSVNLGDGSALVEEFSTVSGTFMGQVDPSTTRYGHGLPGLRGPNEQARLDMSGLARLIRDIGVAGAGGAVTQAIVEFLK